MQKGEDAAAESGMPFSSKGSIDMAKKRITSIKENTYIHLPGTPSSIEEAKLAIRVEQYRKELNEYVNRNCYKKCKQEDNLTTAKRRG